MKKALKYVGLGLIGLVVAAGLFFFCLYASRFQTMASIKRITDFEDGYNLYEMTVKYDYDTQAIIDYGINNTQDYLDAVVKESMPLLPISIKLPSYGCSVYRAVDDKGTAIMGRNYDFKLDTSCMLVRCNPKNGYSSIAFAALNNVGANEADASLKTKMACLTSPFGCLDGINEKGVSIAVLTLDSDPTDQQNGNEKITCSIAIRLVLDNCATTQEAVDLLRKYDMYAVNGRDYHLFISDASGDSRTIEYDPEQPDRPFVDTPIQAVTNFYAMYIDKVESYQRNGIYGHGKERYDHMMEVIDECDGVLNMDNAFRALRAAATEPNPENVTSNTQWSIVFKNEDGNPGAAIVIRRRWEIPYYISLLLD